MNNNEGSFNDEELRKRAASNEELNIRLTNNYAFQKSGRWWFMSGLGFIRRMFWSCIGWCECCDIVA